jgi:hypothetical protein
MLFSDDILKYILSFAEPQTIVSLAPTNQLIHKLSHEYLDKCHREIEDCWNNMARLVMNAGCKSIRKDRCDGCHNTEYCQLNCQIFLHKIHNLEVDYFHFPRDVDLLSWLEDGKQIGYTMM